MHRHLRLPDAMLLPSYNVLRFAPELQRKSKAFSLTFAVRRHCVLQRERWLAMMQNAEFTEGG